MRILLALFLGALSAFLSGYVAVYEVTNELSTIGVKTWYGFPLQHVMNAPGLSRAQWDISAYLINFLIFTAIFWFVSSYVIRALKRK